MLGSARRPHRSPQPGSEKNPACIRNRDAEPGHDPCSGGPQQRLGMRRPGDVDADCPLLDPAAAFSLGLSLPMHEVLQHQQHQQQPSAVLRSRPPFVLTEPPASLSSEVPVVPCSGMELGRQGPPSSHLPPLPQPPRGHLPPLPQPPDSQLPPLPQPPGGHRPPLPQPAQQPYAQRSATGAERALPSVLQSAPSTMANTVAAPQSNTHVRSGVVSPAICCVSFLATAFHQGGGEPTGTKPFAGPASMAFPATPLTQCSSRSGRC